VFECVLVVRTYGLFVDSSFVYFVVWDRNLGCGVGNLFE
jgi:hypothetical protein